MYLQKRRKRYHFRMRVPTDLIGLVGAREVVRSLRTSDSRVARAQACLLRSELHGAFDQVRMKRRLGWSAEDQWLLIRSTLQSGDEIHAEKPRTLSWLMQQLLADKEGAIDRRTVVNVRYCLVSRFRSSHDFRLLFSGFDCLEAEPLDGGEDVIGGFGPFEGFGVLVCRVDVVEDGALQLLGGAMDAAPDLLVGQQPEPALDLVQPGGVNRR